MSRPNERPPGKRQQLLTNLQRTHGHRIQAHSQTRTATRTAIIGTSVQSIETTALPMLPHPVLTLPHQSSEATASETEGPILPEEENPRMSRTAQEFEDAKDLIHSIIMEQYASPLVGTDCPCNVPGAQRMTRCSDCQFREPTCTDCFILGHQTEPTHWAEKWDPHKGFFIRHDISCLRPEGYAIPFGHNGVSCPKYSSGTQDILFHIVDTNGIHNTRIRFCECTVNDRAVQLLKAGFFPATLTQPRMAFSFNVLKWFHRLHLESKVSAYDFVASLRRLTDNAFAHRVMDPYPQFLLVMRIWRVITAEKRLGHVHGIDKVLQHRQPGNLIVHCPVCPEPGFNTEPGWQQTPSHLRHLSQTTFTADGNHHLNKFVKNTDPNDVSFFRGRAYFPEDSEFQRYLRMIPDKGAEKTTCNHLNVLNKQRTKKFRNMDRSGTVNIQCDHIFIKASVDLQLGERFVNTDYALAHAIKQIRASEDPDDPDKFHTSCDNLFSYDISCAYSVNAVERFSNSFPEMVPRIMELRWLIPVVHVHNHKDNCMYLFSSAYVPGAGHKQGETAEMTWAEFNQLGPQTRQMNNGHWQDTIIDHYGDWNWKKTANMPTTLFNDLMRAKKLFIEKRDAFKALLDVYRERVPIWNQKDRTLRIVRNKEVQCVYRQNQAKVPSQARIYQAILTELDTDNQMGHATEKTPVASFLNEGIEILSLQRKLSFQIKKSHGENTEFEAQRDSLRTRITEWRRTQETVMPQVGEYVQRQVLSSQRPNEVEREILFLPSDFPLATQVMLNLTSLGEYQRRLLEGAACDDKKKNARGQAMNTKATAKLQKATDANLLAIEDYNAIRQAMIALGLSQDDSMYPPLSIEDTYRKSTHVKRAVGDSQRTDGLLWTSTGVAAGVSRIHDPADPTALSSIAASAVGTQGSKAKKRKGVYNRRGLPKGKRRRTAAPGDVVPTKKANEDGWIWRFTAGSLSDTDIKEWLDEGDSVQFFRAEAEMQRWQEEWESKQAEFLRCIQSFHKSSNVWQELSHIVSHGGEIAYARKKSAMFQEMAELATSEFIAAGYEDRLTTITGDQVLADLDMSFTAVGIDAPEETPAVSDSGSGTVSDDDSDSDEGWEDD